LKTTSALFKQRVRSEQNTQAGQRSQKSALVKKITYLRIGIMKFS